MTLPRYFVDPSARFAAMACVLLWIILIPVVLIGYWQFVDTTPPVENVKGKFLGWDKEFPRRGWIEWSANFNRSCPGTAYRWLVDGIVIELAPINIPYTGNLGELDNGPLVWHMPFEIPDYFRRDSKHRVHIEYNCNPWQHIVPLEIGFPDVPVPAPPGLPPRPTPPQPDIQSAPPPVVPPEDTRSRRRLNNNSVG